MTSRKKIQSRLRRSKRTEYLESLQSAPTMTESVSKAKPFLTVILPVVNVALIAVDNAKSISRISIECYQN